MDSYLKDRYEARITGLRAEVATLLDEINELTEMNRKLVRNLDILNELKQVEVL